MRCTISGSGNRAVVRGTTNVILAAVSALTSTACWETHTYAPPAHEVIEIGALLSLSGPNGGAGPMHAAAMQCALEDARTELASSGVDLRLSFSDTQSDPYAASVLLNTNLLRNIRITIGPFTSAQVAAVEPRITDSHGLLISPSSTSLLLANRNDHIFRMAPNDSHMVEQLVDLILARDHEFLVLVYRDDVWGRSVVADLDRQFSDRGGTIVSTYAFDPQHTEEIVSILRQVRDDIDAVTQGGPASEVAIQLTSMVEGALFFEMAADSVPELRNVRWYGSDGFVGDWGFFRNYELAEFAADVGYTAPTYRVHVPESFWHVVDRIEYLTGATPGSYSLLTYDATRIAAHTLARVGSNASYAELENALREVAADYVGVSGCVQLDAMGDRFGGDYDFYTVQTDGWEFWWERISGTAASSQVVSESDRE